jgi:hypothetical protein
VISVNLPSTASPSTSGSRCFMPLRGTVLSRLLRFLGACSLVAGTGACRSTPSPASPVPLRDVAADSAVLTRKALDWWAAYMTADSSYFTSFLAEDFVSRQSTVESGGDAHREQFLRYYFMGMPCGEASSYQVQLASVSLFDSIGVVTTQIRFWSGRPFVKSIASQGEAVLTLIAVRRAGEWRALEARIIDYQLPPSVWAWPDTTLLIGPRYRTNPLTAMRTVRRPCPPRPPVPPLRPSLPEPGVLLRLTVIDSATGRPIRRASAGAFVYLPDGGMRWRGATGDSLGHIAFDSVRAWPVEITCRTMERYKGARVAQLDSATLVNAADRAWEVRGDGSACDQRPVVVQRGRWRGRYSAGFELSEFRWCGDTARAIWLEFGSETAKSPRVKWPPRTDPYTYSAFITVVGTMRGPDRYGHLGGATHELEVDSVLSARAVGPRDCR